MPLKIQGWKREAHLKNVYSCRFSADGLMDHQLCLKLESRANRSSRGNEAVLYMIAGHCAGSFGVFEAYLSNGRSFAGAKFFAGHGYLLDACATHLGADEIQSSQDLRGKLEKWFDTQKTGIGYGFIQGLLQRPELPQKYRSAVKQFV